MVRRRLVKLYGLPEEDFLKRDFNPSEHYPFQSFLLFFRSKCDMARRDCWRTQANDNFTQQRHP